jgi:hypothetical protein
MGIKEFLVMKLNLTIPSFLNAIIFVSGKSLKAISSLPSKTFISIYGFEAKGILLPKPFNSDNSMVTSSFILYESFDGLSLFY